MNHRIQLVVSQLSYHKSTINPFKSCFYRIPKATKDSLAVKTPFDKRITGPVQDSGRGLKSMPPWKEAINHPNKGIRTVGQMQLEMVHYLGLPHDRICHCFSGMILLLRKRWSTKLGWSMSGGECQQVRFRGRLGQLFHNGIQRLQSPKYESLASKLTE